MIHRNVEVVDLYPLTWRNLGQVMCIEDLAIQHPLQKPTLSILHQDGRLLRVATPQGMNIQLEPYIGDPQRMARELYTQYADKVEGVQVFDKASLVRFSDAVQRLDWRNLTSGDFYLCAYELAQADADGIVYYPPSQAPQWAVWFRQAQQLIATVPDGQTLVLGVYENGKPYFTLILKIEQQQITLCTTFEYLQPYGVDAAIIPASAADAEQIISLVEQHVGKVAHSLFCDRTAFETWRDGLVEMAYAVDQAAERL